MPSPRGTGSGRRTVVWALCFLLLLPEASSAKTVWRRALHARLAEKPRAEEAGGPRQPRADLCPPAVRVFIAHNDQQLTHRGRDSPLLDWLVQPKPRWLGGNGWLLDGPEEVLQAEACSTTEDGAEPLLCPTGYDCHILNPGDVAAGIPNRGQCVKQRQQTDGRLLQHRFYKEYPEGDSKNVAEPGRGLLRRFP
ncbi:WAP four-disulfide core domain protein 1 [Suricata suricatta]|uniref:WAP four-disulfide core domain protein 1 n=1 Tax=Suricata suricatta TaxID=37032 RepID=UPI001155E43A|nr:WAP four-disulfide core domain protein 1 [Suricata suricatta]